MEFKDEIIEEINEEQPEIVTEETITFEPIKEEQVESTEKNITALDNYESDKKRGKKALLLFLVILLILDVTALVIYIIGIDKVLGFIK